MKPATKEEKVVQEQALLQAQLQSLQSQNNSQQYWARFRCLSSDSNL